MKDNKNRKLLSMATVYRIAHSIIGTSPEFANITIPVDGKINIEGISGDSYITFNSTSGDIEIYKNGTKVVSW